MLLNHSGGQHQGKHGLSKQVRLPVWDRLFTSTCPSTGSLGTQKKKVD